MNCIELILLVIAPISFGVAFAQAWGKHGQWYTIPGFVIGAAMVYIAVYILSRIADLLP
ncbi:MAG: hypothetical protein WCJ56_06280 [bacterium]